MTMYQYGPWNTLAKEHMEQLGKLLLAFTLKFSQPTEVPFQANLASSTTLTTFEGLQAPHTPTPSDASKNHIRTGKTGTTMAIKKSVPPAKPEKLKSESTKKAGTAAPPKKPGIGKGKTTEVTETTGPASLSGTTRPSGTSRTSKTSEKSAPPAKSKKLKTEEVETTEESAPPEKPKTNTSETDETIAPTETTRMPKMPTSSKQSGNGKGKMIETTERTEERGSSAATRMVEPTRKTLPFRNSGKSKDKEAE